MNAWRRELGMFILLLVLIVIAWYGSSGAFFGTDNIANLLRRTGLFGIFSLGVGLVIITTGIDLSIGSMLALLGALLCLLIDITAVNTVPADPLMMILLGIGSILMLAYVVLHTFPEKLDSKRGLIRSLSGVLGIVLFIGALYMILTASGESSDLRGTIPWPFAVLVTLVLGLYLGAFHGTSIARFGMPAFIVTLCGLLFYRGMARVVTAEQSTSIPVIQPTPDDLESRYMFLYNITEGKLLGLPIPFLILIGLSILLYVFLQRSVFGRYIYAIGRNEEAARYSGIDTRRVIIVTYIIAAGLTAISSPMWAINNTTVGPSTHGNFFELWAIAGAVLGGCSLRGGEGSVLGILIGVAVLQVLRSMASLLGFGNQWDWPIIGAVIFIGVFLDTNGGKIWGQLTRKANH